MITAESFLFQIKQACPELDDPSVKKSHPDKSLQKHIEECEKGVEKLLEQIGYNAELKTIGKILAVTHDVGKLHPDWQLHMSGKQKIKHANESVKILKKVGIESINPEIGKLWETLLYLISKHHSSLYFDDTFEGILKIDGVLRSMNPAQRIALADIFGIFKLVDIVSASFGRDFDQYINNVCNQYIWSLTLEDKIERHIKKKAVEKTGHISLEKLDKQKKLAQISKKHLFVIAPTGWGKTALSLLRMACLKPKKIFYVLPTITAIKEFGGELRKVFGEENVGEFFYFEDVELVEKGYKDQEFTHSLEFYRYFIPKITVTTIDQILLTLSFVGKYHLRRFNFKDSLLIFDEFHLFTPKMIGVLKASSELLSHYNISTLFMSATPTMGYIESLKEVLSPAIQKLEEEYRKLQRHKISLEEEIEEFVLKNIDKIRNKFKGGQKILIITNTVPKAVNIYKMLNGLSELKGNIGLLHSRFAYKDRIEREKELELKKKRVIVATQVAEVSLDITSDEIITEVAPLPSIIQRLGRVNRYDRKTDRTNAWICKTKDPHPYSPLEIRETQRVLGELVENIEEKGEGAYLETLAQYEFNLLQVVDESYKKFRKRLEDNNFFYACKAGKEEFGREMNLPAIPQCYSNHTRDILQKIRLSTNYSKCKYLYAEIKKHILPLPAHLQKRLKDVYVWDEELQCFVGVSGDPYDSSLGLVID